MTTSRPRLIGTHHHHLTNVVGPGTDVGEVIFGLVKSFTNNEGADLDLGDVVKIDAAGDDFVKKTETLADPLVVGVVAAVGPFADGDPVPVLIMGYHAAVKVTGSVSRGDYLTASATDGTAEVQAPGTVGGFARATREDNAGTVAAIIFEPELGAAGDAFTDLIDAPADYSGASAGDAVIVNATVDGLEFGPMTGGGGGTAYQNAIDQPPGSPNTMDDEFDDSSGMSGSVNGLNARWAWWTQGTATISLATADRAIIKAPTAAGPNWHGIDQAIPASTNFEITAKISIAAKFANYWRAGLTFRSASGEIYVLGFYYSTGHGIDFQRYTSSTAFNSSPGGGFAGAFGAPIYVRFIFTLSGTTIRTQFSRDGIAWSTFGVITSGITITRVGVGVDNESSGEDCNLHVEWFRRTA